MVIDQKILSMILTGDFNSSINPDLLEGFYREYIFNLVDLLTEGFTLIEDKYPLVEEKLKELDLILNEEAEADLKSFETLLLKLNEISLVNEEVKNKTVDIISLYNDSIIEFYKGVLTEEKVEELEDYIDSRIELVEDMEISYYINLFKKLGIINNVSDIITPNSVSSAPTDNKTDTNPNEVSRPKLVTTLP